MYNVGGFCRFFNAKFEKRPKNFVYPPILNKSEMQFEQFKEVITTSK
jgi:hypothetical protein